MRSRIYSVFIENFYEVDGRCEDSFVDFANRIFEIIIGRLPFVNESNKTVEIIQIITK